MKCSWPQATLSLISPSYPSNLGDERENMNHLLILVLFSRFCSLENNDKYPGLSNLIFSAQFFMYVFIFLETNFDDNEISPSLFIA